MSELHNVCILIFSMSVEKREIRVHLTNAADRQNRRWSFFLDGSLCSSFLQWSQRSLRPNAIFHKTPPWFGFFPSFYISCSVSLFLFYFYFLPFPSFYLFLFSSLFSFSIYSRFPSCPPVPSFSLLFLRFLFLLSFFYLFLSIHLYFLVQNFSCLGSIFCKEIGKRWY